MESRNLEIWKNWKKSAIHSHSYKTPLTRHRFCCKRWPWLQAYTGTTGEELKYRFENFTTGPIRSVGWAQVVTRSKKSCHKTWKPSKHWNDPVLLLCLGQVWWCRRRNNSSALLYWLLICSCLRVTRGKLLQWSHANATFKRECTVRMYAQPKKRPKIEQAHHRSVCSRYALYGYSMHTKMFDENVPHVRLETSDRRHTAVPTAFSWCGHVALICLHGAATTIQARACSEPPT